MGETDNRYPGAEMARLMQIGIEPIKSDVTEKHAYMVRNEPFIIHKKYDIQSVIGMGAYGLVVSAINSETQQKVAVKKVSNLFESLGDAKRILREVRLMRVLKHDKVGRRIHRGLL